jgi:hypothetical protein
VFIEPVVMGGTYDWFLNPASINSELAPTVFAVWNIFAAVVTITFTDPNGNQQTFTASALSSPGQARYINLAGLFFTPGWWGVSWTVALGGTVLPTQRFPFQVYAP